MKNKIITFLIILIATSLVLYFSLKDDFNTILNTMLNINKIWLFVSFLLLFGYYFLKSIVTYTFAQEFNKNYKIKDAFKLTLKTNFFHAITPFSAGGQPYEIYSLSRENIKISDAANISIECFIVYQIALVFLGIISIVSNCIFKIIKGTFLKHLITLGFIINFMVIVILFWITLSKKTDKKVINLLINFLNKIKIIKKPNDIKIKIDNYLNEFNSGTKILLKDKFKFILMILLELLALISLYLIPMVLFYGIGNYSINGLTCVIIMSYVMLIGSFVPIPGGTGGLEYGFVTFFGSVFKNSKLNAIMLLWRFITYYFGMILGAIIINFKKEKKI